MSVIMFFICCAVNDHGGQVAPWEEENGFFGIMVGVGYAVFLLFTYSQSFNKERIFHVSKESGVV